MAGELEKVLEQNTGTEINDVKPEIKCGFCNMPAIKVTHPVIDFDFFNKPYTPQAESSTYACPECSEEKYMERHYRDIHSEAELLIKEQPSELSNPQTIKKARDRLTEIVSQMENPRYHHAILTDEKKTEIRSFYEDFMKYLQYK